MLSSGRRGVSKSKYEVVVLPSMQRGWCGAVGFVFPSLGLVCPQVNKHAVCWNTLKG